MSHLTTTMEMEKCPECGADVRSRDTLCWNCGRSLRTTPPSPQPEQSSSSARLIVMTSAGEVVQDYLLDKAVVIIGPLAPADIVFVKDRQVSRRHASVRYEQGHDVLRKVHRTQDQRSSCVLSL